MVCSSSFEICKDPLLWRTIDIRRFGPLRPLFGLALQKICRCAVGQSSGELVEIILGDVATNELLKNIARKSSRIKHLHLIGGYFAKDGLGKAVSKLPLLEELELSHCTLSTSSLKLVGRRCHHLKSLTLSSHCIITVPYIGPDEEAELNKEAMAIAEHMPALRTLKLYGNTLTNVGLQAILDGCPHLESLDVRKCCNLNIGGDDFPSGISGIDFRCDDPEVLPTMGMNVESSQVTLSRFNTLYVYYIIPHFVLHLSLVMFCIGRGSFEPG
ncbi:hypothetical protein L484_014851 [Morus notabilis]|uniref:Uncharacterized protein n=1 Tax=Morus notabilis TaxID=981085 RepID=W9QM31_9ROSA|nr:hypothetical protein L484_014851 [Morus notabilis]